MDELTVDYFTSAIEDWTLIEGGFDFQRMFPNDEVCREFMYRKRWPVGFVCPRCRDLSGYLISTRNLVECTNHKCKYQTSLTSGTLFHRTRLSMRTWFYAIYLFTVRKEYSPTSMSIKLGVSYKTAWSMVNKMWRAFKAFYSETDKDLRHPIEVILNNPDDVDFLFPLTEERRMELECAREDMEEEGLFPSHPPAKEALMAAGLTLRKKLTREEWIRRRRLTQFWFRVIPPRLEYCFLFVLISGVSVVPVHIWELGVRRLNVKVQLKAA